ncbi:MAG: preprotein translocase subunit SecA [Verrucomicrobiaceae bacterium]|nr:preprotein translocase subunit SecA [Verrucomicrobiaceae bacterium]
MILSSLPSHLFHSRNDRRLRKWRTALKHTHTREKSFESLEEHQFAEQTMRWKAELSEVEDQSTLRRRLTQLAPEAFALVLQASRRLVGRTLSQQGDQRVWDMAFHDVQLIGGQAMQEGAIAEMGTGEGKTLTATLPAYLMALAGKGVHIVTVNDYLAKRDAEWMGHIYSLLGLTVGCLQSDGDFASRQAAYWADVTYGTASEFGFDYLRDHCLTNSADQQVQRSPFFALIDEIDSVLIDEARAPLIISGPAVYDRSASYTEMASGVGRLVEAQRKDCDQRLDEARLLLGAGEEREAALLLLQVQLAMTKHPGLRKMVEDPSLLRMLERTHVAMHVDHKRSELAALKEELYFSLNSPRRQVDLTERGCRLLSPHDPEAFVLPPWEEGGQEVGAELSDRAARIHAVNQLLRAYTLYERDQDYHVVEGQVEIIDSEQGRPMAGRRWSDGLHQAMEAKEGVDVQPENTTLATITLQNYLRLYPLLAGMTGTALPEETEFNEAFGLNVAAIPPHKPCCREDAGDRVYLTHREKIGAVVREIQEAHSRKQPVLVGTAHVDISEVLSRRLRREGIPHRVLNAKRPAEEAEIIANAGQPGAVTVSTNMAGRGTDIRLAEGVAELGGLYVIGTERHQSSRVDLQLRGRSGRQGDAGVTKFFVSLEDSLFKRFGHSDRLMGWLQRLGHREGEALEHGMLSRTFARAQGQLEQAHSEERRNLRKYDDILHSQRTSVYEWRRDLLELPCSDLVAALIDQCQDSETAIKSWEGFLERWSSVDSGVRQSLERQILLCVLDTRWAGRLEWLQDLREDVSLERFAQRDPLMEYRRRAVDRFADLEKEICEASITQVCALQPPETRPEIVFPKPARPEVSRNAPCLCGRARKYKRCCSQRLQS